MATEKVTALQTDVLTGDIGKHIITLRGFQVMLDSDLAGIYEVELRALKQAVRRNVGRFPGDFMFQLTKKDLENLRSQSVISSVENFFEGDAKPNLRSQSVISSLENELRPHGGSRYLPFAFTELGVAMLSSVLHSERAILLNIGIMRAFVRLKKESHCDQADLVPKLDSLENMFKQRFDRLEAQFQNRPAQTHNFTKRDPVGLIQNAVARHFGLTGQDLKSTARTQGISLPRQIAIYLARKNLCMGLSEIGRHFGGRDHTTVLHAYRKILGDAEKNTMIRTAVSALQNEIKPQLA